MPDMDFEGRRLERRCAHCECDAPGTDYTGVAYLLALQKHTGDEAMRLARKVEPFFWGDADIIHVKLCRTCAGKLGIEEPPQEESAGENADDSPQTYEQGRIHAHPSRIRRRQLGRRKGDMSRRLGGEAGATFRGVYHKFRT